MSALVYVLAAVTVAFAVFTVVLRRRGKSFYGMVCKFMASFGFMSVAFVGYCLNPHDSIYFCLVVFGLLFGLGGDVLLGIKEIAPKFRPQLIPLGTVSFLICHIFFLGACLKISGFQPVPIVLAGIAALAAATLMKGLKFKVDMKLWLLMSLYFFTLCYKMTTFGYLVFSLRKPAFIVGFIGAVLFVISDTCLSFLYFTPVKSKNVLVTVELATYYPAQILLAMSVALISMPAISF